jgi:hypothetical protein
MCRGTNIQVKRCRRRFFSASLCFSYRTSRGRLALSHKLYRRKERQQRSNFRTNFRTHFTHTQITIVFVKSGVIWARFIPCPHEITKRSMRNNNQSKEDEAERGQLRQGRCWSKPSRSFYGLLEPQDVYMRATCHLAFNAPANEGVVLEIFLTSL